MLPEIVVEGDLSSGNGAGFEMYEQSLPFSQRGFSNCIQVMDA